MEFSAAWVSAIVAVFAFGITIGTYVGTRRERVRKALPIIRTKWSSGEAGCAAAVTIINRTDEDLYVTEIVAKGTIVDRKSEVDPNSNPVFNWREVPRGSRWTVNWLVKPGETYRDTVYIKGLRDVPQRWLRFTISSSAETLRRKRVISRDNTTQ